MYKVGQLFMLNIKATSAIWEIVEVNKEKDEYTLKCVENCALKGMRKKVTKSKFDAEISTELPRIIPEEEREQKDSADRSCIK